MKRPSALTSLLAMSMAVSACSDKSVSGPDTTPIITPAPTATVGAIEISISTSGPDQDTDGYTLSATAPKTHQFARLPVTGKYLISGTEPGEVRLVLYGLANNCALAGSNPLTLKVKAGETTAVSYVISCVASGSLRITTVTTGVDTDNDGYVMWDRDRAINGSDIAHSFTSGLDSHLPVNGTTTLTSLVPGIYPIEIHNIAPNCTPSPAAMQTVSVTAGAETAVTLTITCESAGQIAFVRGAGEFEWEASSIANKDIYLVNSSGTTFLRLTSSPGADINPAWSPDGKKIAFASDRDGNREIYVMNADGTGQVRLTNNDARDYSPAFSPDGKRIVFVSERPDKVPHIYIMDADGSNVSQLTNGPLADLDPVFSPDGSRIAFRTSGVGLHVMNPDGSAQVRLTNSGSDAQPAYSPDGTTIAVLRFEREIWLMDTNGTQARQFFYWNYSRGNPEWSPDGRRIAFDDRDCWDNGPCPRGIVIATIEGQYSIQIDDASEPAWKPR